MADPTPPPTDPTPPAPGPDPTVPPVDEWKPPSKEDWEKLVRQRDELKAKRREQEEREQRAAREKQTAEERAAAEQRDAQVNKTKRIGVVAELVAAGLTKEAAKKAVRLIDLSEVSIDEDDDVDASEAVKALKADMPGLFYKNANRAPDRVTRDRSGGSTTETPEERHTRRLLGQAGYRV